MPRQVRWVLPWRAVHRWGTTRRGALVGLVAGLLTLVAACSDDGDSSVAADAASTTSTSHRPSTTRPLPTTTSAAPTTTTTPVPATLAPVVAGDRPHAALEPVALAQQTPGRRARGPRPGREP